MELFEAIKERRSIRAFQNLHVARQDVLDILEAARWAPSGSNLQPWEFWVFAGKKRQRLTDRLLEAYYGSGISYEPGRGGTVTSKYAERTASLLTGMTQSLAQAHIRDTEWIMKGSLKFYGAPVVILVLLDRQLKGQEFNAGIALQNLLLATHDKGLGACPIGIALMFEPIIRDTLKIPETYSILTTVAIGHPDKNSPLNSFKSPRVPIEEITFIEGLDT
ncbi:MAG: nitroreductase [Thermodesulfobacteriota bacterium]|nr:nitroreductase [Thermodesulfobacteriota bacterium]